MKTSNTQTSEIPLSSQVLMERWVILCGILTTLFVSPWWSYDPISLPKMLVLATIAGWLLGPIFVNWRVNLKGSNRQIVSALALFVIWSGLTFLFSNAPKDQQFWGVFGRNTGILTYLSLCIILLAASMVSKKGFSENILRALIVTGSLLSVYGFIQMLGLDPIRWSSNDVFATLGNTNFLSSFLAISAIPIVALLLGNEFRQIIRVFLTALLLFITFIIYATSSMQGFVVLVLGALIIVSIKWIVFDLRWYIRIPLSIFGLASIFLSGLGLIGKGALASILRQETITYRMDYMHSAIEIMSKFPIFGVGYDAYGDWYRATRGLISAYRTSPARTANTSHNIFLDVGAAGGVPLFLLYVLITLYIGFIALRRILKADQFNAVYIGLFASWIGFQAQALISINQIGLGVWGWIVGGVLLSPEFDKNSTNEFETKGRRKLSKMTTRNNVKAIGQSSAISVIISCLGVLVFSISALVPFNYDRSFRKLYFSGDALKLVASTKQIGSSAWHLSLIQEAMLKNNYVDLANTTNSTLTSRYPRDIFGWQAMIVLSQDDNRRQFAKRRIAELDPFFTCYWNNPVQDVKNKLSVLPIEKQREILRSWSMPQYLSIDEVSDELFQTKALSFCSSS